VKRIAKIDKTSIIPFCFLGIFLSNVLIKIKEKTRIKMGVKLFIKVGFAHVRKPAKQGFPVITRPINRIRPVNTKLNAIFCMSKKILF